jgi:hypothetical protein
MVIRMLWHCTYQALTKVRASDLARRLLRQHDAGSNRHSDIRGWYAFPTGVAGVVLIEVDTAKELAAILAPYADLVTWQVEAVAELNYNQTLEELRRSTHRAAVDDLASGISPAVLAEYAQRR